MWHLKKKSKTMTEKGGRRRHQWRKGGLQSKQMKERRENERTITQKKGCNECRQMKGQENETPEDRGERLQ